MAGHGRSARGIDGDAGAFGNGCRNIPFALEEERIARRRLDRGVAEDRGDAEKVYFGMTMQEEKRHGVVDARVGVINDLVHEISSRCEP